MVHFLEVVVKVAIIGAGISGIGSSVEFSKNDIEHIIIEARNRTGGRITQAVLDGVTIQYGAESPLITPDQTYIVDFLNEQGWNYEYNYLFQSRQILSQGQGQLNQTVIAQSHQITKDLCRKAAKKNSYKNRQEDMQTIVDHYFRKIKHKPVEVDLAYWSCQYVGIFNGADLKNLTIDQLCFSKDQGGVYPEGGYSSVVQSIFSYATPKSVNLNQKVTKIDYSGKIVKIYTENKVFLAQKVISTLPLGVLKQNFVQFVPQLSKERKEAIKTMGFGIFNKIFVSFEAPFWDTSKRWIGFVVKHGINRYPMAQTILDGGRYILVFYTYASRSQEINKMSDEEIRGDLLQFLRTFFPNTPIAIRDLIATRWSQDPLALGSYSYAPNGANAQDLINKYCAPLDNKVWFAGEHCNLKNLGYSNPAYQSGIWAAGNITALLKS